MSSTDERNPLTDKASDSDASSSNDGRHQSTQEQQQQENQQHQQRQRQQQRQQQRQSREERQMVPQTIAHDSLTAASLLNRDGSTPISSSDHDSADRPDQIRTNSLLSSSLTGMNTNANIQTQGVHPAGNGMASNQQYWTVTPSTVLERLEALSAMQQERRLMLLAARRNAHNMHGTTGNLSVHDATVQVTTADRVRTNVRTMMSRDMTEPKSFSLDEPITPRDASPIQTAASLLAMRRSIPAQHQTHKSQTPQILSPATLKHYGDIERTAGLHNNTMDFSSSEGRTSLVPSAEPPGSNTRSSSPPPTTTTIYKHSTGAATIDEYKARKSQSHPSSSSSSSSTTSSSSSSSRRPSSAGAPVATVDTKSSDGHCVSTTESSSIPSTASSGSSSPPSDSKQPAHPPPGLSIRASSDMNQPAQLPSTKPPPSAQPPPAKPPPTKPPSKIQLGKKDSTSQVVCQSLGSLPTGTNPLQTTPPAKSKGTDTARKDVLSFPCRARGFRGADQRRHNNAVILVQSDAPHGIILSCSDSTCVASGRRFRWVSS